MTPVAGTTYPLTLFPASPSSQSRTLDRLFELTQRPSRTLNLAFYAASGTTEKQGYSHVWCAR